MYRLAPFRNPSLVLASPASTPTQTTRLPSCWPLASHQSQLTLELNWTCFTCACAGAPQTQALCAIHAVFLTLSYVDFLMIHESYASNIGTDIDEVSAFRYENFLQSTSHHQQYVANCECCTRQNAYHITAHTESQNSAAICKHNRACCCADQCLWTTECWLTVKFSDNCSSCPLPSFTGRSPHFQYCKILRTAPKHTRCM